MSTCALPRPLPPEALGNDRVCRRICLPVLPFWFLVSFLILGITVPAVGAPKAKLTIEFALISFPATREAKAVAFALYRGADAGIQARFDAARSEFDQGILKLNLSGQPTPETVDFFNRLAAAWTAIANETSLSAEIRAAALHNAANCHTVNRDYPKALELATAAATTDPTRSRYGVERNGIRDGFYARRRGYDTVAITAPRLERIGQPQAMAGAISDITLTAPRVAITPMRTVKEALGAIWVNDRKKYRVEYKERFKLHDAPLFAALKLVNRTERVVDCRGVVVQVSVNGNSVGGPKELQWEGDPARVVPNGHVVATFSVAPPQALPAKGTLTIAVFDVPSAVSATGAIEGKRNDTFTWSIAAAKYAFDAMNRVVEEKITSADAAEQRPVAQEVRYETLSQPAE